LEEEEREVEALALGLDVDGVGEEERLAEGESEVRRDMKLEEGATSGFEGGALSLIEERGRRKETE
jgi:hypothetical protein